MGTPRCRRPGPAPSAMSSRQASLHPGTCVTCVQMHVRGVCAASFPRSAIPARCCLHAPVKFSVQISTRRLRPWWRRCTSAPGCGCPRRTQMHRCTPGACNASPNQHLPVFMSGNRKRSNAGHHTASDPPCTVFRLHPQPNESACCLTCRCESMWRG